MTSLIQCGSKFTVTRPKTEMLLADYSHFEVVVKCGIIGLAIRLIEVFGFSG